MRFKKVMVVNEKSDSKLENEDCGKEWPQIVAILSATLSTLTCGILFSWPSPTIPLLLAGEFSEEVTLEQASYLTVIPPITWGFASLIFAYIPDIIGRKYSLLLVVIPHLATWALVYFGESIWMLYLSRLTDGIGDACTLTVLPMYFGEIATPKVRGVWGNAISLTIASGQLVVNIVGSYLSIRHTAIVLAAIPILFLLSFYHMPESPYYLLMRGRKEEARAALQWLRRMRHVDAEFAQIQADVARQQSESGTARDLFMIGSNRRALLIGATARFSQQFAGIGAFATYTKYLFQEAGGSVDATTSVILFSAVLLVAMMVTSGLLDKFGRRRPMIASSCGCAVCLFLLAAYLYCQQYGTLDVSSFQWFPIAGMLAFVPVFTMGLAIVPNILLGEIFSSSIKAKALCVMNMCFAVSVAGSTKLFQVLLAAYGLWVPMAFYGVCCVCSALVSYCLVPETTGKTLEQIQQELKGITEKSKVKDAVVSESKF